jgi:hypothetical protein
VPLNYSKEMVGLGRLELPTSPLSGVRSSHLSYRPSVYAADFIITGESSIAPNQSAEQKTKYRLSVKPYKGSAK